jgi:predicted Fe-Mo cluster-binding NifX family protein
VRVAIPIWAGRVSPVFDVAKRLLVAEIEDDQELTVSQRFIADVRPEYRGKYLSEIGVDVLICGAISRTMETLITAAGVNLIAQVTGTIEQVLLALKSGQLAESEFVAPGCAHLDYTSRAFSRLMEDDTHPRQPKQKSSFGTSSTRQKDEMRAELEVTDRPMSDN